MALITDMDLMDPDGVSTGHIDGNTLNAPRTKTMAGQEINAIGWGAAVCYGTLGSISYQEVSGFEQEEMIGPSKYVRIDTGDGNGFGEWLKVC